MIKRSLLLSLLLAATAAQAQDKAAAQPDMAKAKQTAEQVCAACHGADLEGQPNWRSSDANGLYPAPPHDETGHTWHHDDAMLIDYITRGGQAVLDDMDVTFTSGMPDFGSVLDQSEIEAILDYIKSTWPQHIRDAQAQRSIAAGAD